MDEFDRVLDQATRNGVLPGTCVIAADKNGEDTTHSVVTLLLSKL